MCNELDYVTYDSYILEDPNDMHDYLFVYTNFTISGIYCPQNALSFVDCETSLHEENCPSQMGIKLMCKNPEGNINSLYGYCSIYQADYSPLKVQEMFWLDFSL
jgi:hypothetical protein